MLQFPIPVPGNFFFQRVLALYDAGAIQGIINAIDFVGDHVVATITTPPNIGRVTIDFITENPFDENLAVWLKATTSITLSDSNSYGAFVPLIVGKSMNFGYTEGESIDYITIPELASYNLQITANGEVVSDALCDPVVRRNGFASISVVVYRYNSVGTLQHIYLGSGRNFQCPDAVPSLGTTFSIRFNKNMTLFANQRLKVYVTMGTGGAFLLSDPLSITVNDIAIDLVKLPSLLEGFEEE